MRYILFLGYVISAFIVIGRKVAIAVDLVCDAVMWPFRRDYRAILRFLGRARQPATVRVSNLLRPDNDDCLDTSDQSFTPRPYDPLC